MAGVWKWSSGNEAVDEAPVLESAGDLQLQSPLLLLRRQRLMDSVLVWHKVAAVSGLSRAFVLEMALGLSAVTEILLSCFLPSVLFVLNSLMIVLIFERVHSLSCLFVFFRACSFLGFHKWWNSRSFVYFLCIARRHLFRWSWSWLCKLMKCKVRSRSLCLLVPLSCLTPLCRENWTNRLCLQQG